jgi:hypothetical protein
MRLKLRVAGRQVVGTLVEMRSDSIVLAWNSGHTSYPTASVTDVKVSRGKSAWTGAQFGALIGAGVGAVGAIRNSVLPNEANGLRDPDCDVTTTSCPSDSDLRDATEQVAAYTLLGALAGAVIRRERWVNSALPTAPGEREPARLLFAPSRGGMRIGVHATF